MSSSLSLCCESMVPSTTTSWQRRSDRAPNSSCGCFFHHSSYLQTGWQSCRRSSPLWIRPSLTAPRPGWAPPGTCFPGRRQWMQPAHLWVEGFRSPLGDTSSSCCWSTSNNFKTQNQLWDSCIRFLITFQFKAQDRRIFLWITLLFRCNLKNTSIPTGSLIFKFLIFYKTKWVRKHFFPSLSELSC